MALDNQKKLYEHFLNQIENPGNPKIMSQDIDFIVKQAKAQVAAILKVYPQFAGAKESKVKGKN